MKVLAKGIVKLRFLILILSTLLLFPAALGYVRTRINYDVLSYLPGEIETMVGQNILEDDFGTGAFSMVVVEGMEFKDVAELYSVLYHEMSHSTGHKSRLARITDIANFGSDLYAQEELVAELGAGFLVHHVGLETPASFRNSAAYLRGWLKALHDDKRLIVRAAGQAEKAVRYILGEEAEQNDP